jgi:hypothetical protein
MNFRTRGSHVSRNEIVLRLLFSSNTSAMQQSLLLSFALNRIKEIERLHTVGMRVAARSTG